MASTKPPDKAKPSALTSPMATGDMEIARGVIYVAASNSAIDEFSTSGMLLRSVAIPWVHSVNSFALDPEGGLYVERASDQLVKLSPAGVVQWTITERQQLTGIFGHQLGREWVVGATEQSGPARLYNARGRYIGSRPVKGVLFTTAPDGGLVATDSAYVRKYNRRLRPVFSFGGAGRGQTPVAGEFDFYLQGDAVQLPDGRYVVSDSGRGLEVFSSDGLLLGTMPDSQVGALTQRAALQLRGSTLYLENGGPWVSTQTVATIAVSNVVRGALDRVLHLRVSASEPAFASGRSPDTLLPGSGQPQPPCSIRGGSSSPTCASATRCSTPHKPRGEAAEHILLRSRRRAFGREYRCASRPPLPAPTRSTFGSTTTREPFRRNASTTRSARPVTC